MKKITFLLLLLFISNAYSQEKTKALPWYKEMMYNKEINFYTVCDSAEAYFKTIDKDKKGSGYKPFMRWKHENESFYYPSGNRMLDDEIPYKEYLRIKTEEEKSNTLQRVARSAAGWQSIGPEEITNITGHYSAGLGRLEFVRVNKTNDQQIYLGSRSGGLWRTSNGGATWSHNTDFLPASGVNAIAAKPTDFNQVLINCQSARTYYSFGIYKSTDGGNNFVATNFIPANLGFGGLGSDFKVYTIQYHPTIANLVFVGTNKGIFRSTDNLQTWVRYRSTSSIYDIEFHPTDPNIIYIYDHLTANRNRIGKSIDNGLTYTNMALLPGANASEILKLTPISTATCPNCLYATSSAGIWKSTDSGVTFTAIINPAPTGVSLSGVMPNDTDDTKFVGGYQDLFRSTDSGITFNQCTWWSLGTNNGGGTYQQNFNTSTHYIHADTDYLDCVNGIFYACTDGFLSKSSDSGVTWQKISLAIGVRENYCIGNSQSNNAVTIAGSQDNGISVKNESGWIETYGADGMEAIISPLNPDYKIGSIQSGGRRRYTDTACSTSSGVTPPGQVGNWQAPLDYDPNNQMTIYSFGNAVHKSTNFGTNWIDLADPVTLTSTIQTAAIAENNSNIMVVTCAAAIEISFDGGASFSNIRGTLPNNDIDDVKFDPRDDGTFIVCYSNYQNDGNKVFITRDYGLNWQNITYNLGNVPILSIAIDNDVNPMIYVGGVVGLYKKRMNDTVWTLFNTNLPNVAIADLEINYGANTIKAGTWGRGLWEEKLSGKENYPSIVKTEITNPPTIDTPKTTKSQFVTSEILYSGTLTSVYVAWASGSPNFNATNRIPMYLVSGNTWKTNTPLPDFVDGTKVYFKVFATGSSNDTAETYKFMYDVKPNTICAASGENGSGGLWMNSFILAGNTKTTNSFNGGYAYDATNPFVLNKGNTYTATGNFSTGWVDNDFIIWIDYNNDSVFSIDERVVLDSNTGTVGTGTFTIPSTAVTGFVKMRVRLGYWGNYTTACGATFGEVEDYLVQITNTSEPQITFTASNQICKNTDVVLTYTGYAVDQIKWTIQKESKIYYYTGNDITINFSENGIYTVVISVVKDGVYNYKVFDTYFEFKDTKWDGSSWLNGSPTASSTIEFDGNFSSTSNLTACSCKTTSGNVIFNANHSLNLFKDLNVAGGNLTFNSGASLLQTFGTTNDNLGNITYKRATTNLANNFDFVYWGSPVANQSLANMWMTTTNDTFYTFNTSNSPAQDWVYAAPNTIMEAGKGYIARAFLGSTGWTALNTSYTSNFAGKPNNGNIPYTMINAGGTNIDNLLANPYPSAIDLIAFSTDSDNNTKLTGNFYFWTHKTQLNGNIYNSGDYASYNVNIGAGTGTGSPSSGGSTTPTRFVAAGQGFFAEASSTPGTVIFKNSHRVATNNNSFYRQSSASNVVNSDKIWLNLNNNSGLFKQQLIAYSPNATNDFDPNYDAKSFEGNPDIDFYSIIPNKNLVIQSRTIFTDSDIIPLGFKSTIADNFTISIDHSEGVFASGQTVFIQDNLLGIDHNLSNAPYNFNTTIGNFDNRFVLKYTSTLATNNSDFYGNNLIVVSNKRILKIKSTTEEIKSVAIFDMLGRKVFSQDNINSKRYFKADYMFINQTFILKITLKNGIVVDKKVAF